MYRFTHQIPAKRSAVWEEAVVLIVIRAVGIRHHVGIVCTQLQLHHRHLGSFAHSTFEFADIYTDSCDTT